MPIKKHKALASISLVLIFSVTQVFAQIGLAGTTLAIKGAIAEPDPMPLTARLVTRGNLPVLVNGNSAKTDATILSGAIIESPDGVSATINFGSLGTMDLAPNTSVRIEFSDGKVKVTLIKGCVILKTKKNTEGTVVTDKGEAGKTDKDKNGVLDVCYPFGAASPLVGVGAAASTGAGAIAGGTAAAAAGGGISATTGVLIGSAGLAALTTTAILVTCDHNNGQVMSISAPPSNSSGDCF